MTVKHKITPFLWFNNNAEEAMNLYISLFDNSKIINVARYGSEVPGMEGKVLTGEFELDGLPLRALDGGPEFPFNESFSLQVDCEDQEEVDKLWNALLADGGQESQCGWLKDKFGLSWQIIPRQLGQFLSSEDHEKAGRAMQAMLKMKKIIIADLEKAYNGE